ncbi:MAG TPA: FKBP-type peptidyl-prolyl cis-trans isomerase [Pyrinomonadaceae bacterium]|nr:FKBP-type peptidyl-prolyl cis-trans isomerase [Pyrinomonadaceae bacterium]
MPQSRQRKLNRAKKRPRVPRAGAAETPSSGTNNTLKLAAIALVAAVVLGGVVYFLWPRIHAGNEITTASGLKYVDQVVGTGETPKIGQAVTVNYTGTLENGNKFDSSLDKGQPFTFRLGRDPMIKGWDEGISTMKVGGKRHLIIPSKLGYGPQARPNIPANSTLLFDIELLSVK